MEVVEGETRRSASKKGPYRSPECSNIGSQSGAAIDAAHKAGVVHRDLKPGNVMLTKTCVKVLDSGLAREFLSPDEARGG